MAQFTKHNSNYIKTTRHSFLKDGSTIFERDWVTIGSQLHFGADKIPYYNNGNFIFTTSPTPFYQKKHKNGVTVATWTYDDVSEATDTVNGINIDEYTEDIRSFVYYGSCVELVRTSIENIIKTFPANITLTKESLPIPPSEEEGSYTYLEGYVLNNPFQLDLYTTQVTPSKTENKLKYLSYSFGDYLINGEEITTYEISEWLGDKECPYNDQYYISKSPVLIITINGRYILKGYKVDEDIVFCYEGKDLEITPKQNLIEDYFKSLKGFEKCLLNRKSNPLYSNKFKTPIEHETGIVYYNRTYTWPSNGYCLDITSPLYFDFLNRLTETAELFDELWTDNMWRRMTHEAIKNYDWTYSKEFSEGEEEDNVEGGERMHKVINIIGRVFDDIKHYIDKIKKNNTITYNGDNNIPNALISDKLDLMGWDVYSTIPLYMEEGNTISASNEKIVDYNVEWYPTMNKSELTFADVDINFMRRLILSSKRIMQTKGTINAIDMVMGMFGYGEEDYTITEEYYVTTPKRYDEEVEGEEGTDPLSFGDRIVQLNYNKNIDLLYDDDVSGIPVGSFIKQETNADPKVLENVVYLIPYYDNNRMYDGDLYFQSKGGWKYNGDIDEDGKPLSDYAWEETVSYLHVVSTVGDLLKVNPNSVTDGDIYYVANISDLYDYSEQYNFTSNFFILEDDFNPEMFSSWQMIDMTGKTYEDLEGEEKERYMGYLEKANYLNNIVPNNIGNNPHVGYGKYDLGNEFIEYMRKPFKYSIDKNYFREDMLAMAEKITFDVRRGDDGDKIKVIKTLPDNEVEDYYINSKVVYFKNNHSDNVFYKEYFKSVIIKYLMQVIPSTTIIVLQDFD